MRWVILGFFLTISVGSGRVIVITMDGMRPDVVTLLGRELVPNFFRLRDEGAFTDNARSDYDKTETLPNHTSMITSRPVLGPCGHGVTFNSGGLATNIHITGYNASMFDVAHDHGLTTAIFAGKTKFRAYEGSYSETTGAPDLTGEDHGRKKLDYVTIGISDSLMLAGFLESMVHFKWDLSLVHFRAPDYAGHFYDWDLTPGSEYLASIVEVDGYLGEILTFLDANVEKLGLPHLIVTADHGGTVETYTHVDAPIVTNYTVPLYVRGPGVKAGADLYVLNPELFDPGTSRPTLNSTTRPIRTSIVGNLALQLLNLPPIPGSCVNLSQQFQVNDPPDFETLHPGLDPEGDANGNGITNYGDYLLGGDPLGVSGPILMPRMEGENLIVNLRSNITDSNLQLEISADGRTWGPLLEGATFLKLASEETRTGVAWTLRVPMLGERAFYRQVFRQPR